MPEDPGNATLLDRTGLSINDTILYQCPYGYQVTETGLIYYTITCNLLPDGLSANWSPIPEIERELSCRFLLLTISLDPRVSHLGYAHPIIRRRLSYLFTIGFSSELQRHLSRYEGDIPIERRFHRSCDARRL